MVDYTKSTGSAGTLIIRDNGTTVTFLIACGDGATNIGSPGATWSGQAAGARSGRFTWPSGGGTRVIAGPFTITSSQTVSFGIGGTGTSGLGGPTSFSAAIKRAAAAAPSGLAIVRNSDTQHTLSWTRNAVYTSVIVQRRTDSGAWQQVGAPAGNAFTFTDKTTSADHKFEYRVAGKNAAGQSAWSGISTVYTTPAPPHHLIATRVGNNIELDTRWGEDQTAYVDTYQVFDNGTLVAQNVNEYLPWTHVNPNPLITHTYTMKAVKTGLVGPMSEPSNTVQLPAPPNAPTGLAPNGAVRAADEPVRFGWVHNPIDSSAQTGYELRYRAAGTSSWTTESGTVAAFRDVELSVGGWEWQVRTKGEHPDFSPWSATATAAVIDHPGVAVVQPDTTWELSTLTVVWSWFQEQSRPQSAWEMQLVNEAGDVVETRAGTGAATTATFTRRLTQGVWTVRVRAATGDVWSVWAEETFTVAFVPPVLPSISGLWDEDEGAVALTVASGDPDADVLDVTNLFTNPGFEETAASINLRRNLLRDPDLQVTGQWAASMTGTIALASGNRFLLTGTAAGANRLGVIQTLDAAKAAGTYRLAVNLEALHASLTHARIYLLDTNGSVIRATGQVPLLAGVRRYEFTLTAADVFNRVYIEMVGTSLPAGVSGYMSRPMLEAGSTGGPFFSPGQGTGSPDLTSAFVGSVNTSESVLRGSRATGVSSAVSSALVYQSTEWAASGAKSVKVEPTGAGNNSYGSVVIGGLTAGKTYTAIAKVHLASAQSGALHASWFRRLMAQSTGMPVNNVLSNAAPNAPGEAEVRVTFTLGADTTVTLFLMNGSLSTPVWFDELALVAGTYTGAYFDGDSGSVLVDDVPRRPMWDGAPHASTTTTVAFPATAYVHVERSIDDGETWEHVAEVDDTAALVDWESLSYGDTLYRATAFTADGASAAAEVTVSARSGALWLGGGVGYGVTARLPYDPSVQITAGRQRALKQYAGRSRPVALTGAALTRVVAVSGRVSDRDEQTADVERLALIAQVETELFLFRDPDGRRIYGAIGDIQLPRQSSSLHPDGWEGIWGYSFTLTEATR